MKHSKIILSLMVFLLLSTTSYAAESSKTQDKLQSRIQLSAPTDISEKANNFSSIASPYGDLTDDAVINSTLNGFGNMMKGFSNSPYNAVEEIKQQRDYARQQANYGKQ